jgi:hypothetical protein
MNPDLIALCSISFSLTFIILRLSMWGSDRRERKRPPVDQVWMRSLELAWQELDEIDWRVGLLAAPPEHIAEELKAAEDRKKRDAQVALVDSRRNTFTAQEVADMTVQEYAKMRMETLDRRVARGYEVPPAFMVEDKYKYTTLGGTFLGVDAPWGEIEDVSVDNPPEGPVLRRPVRRPP